MHLIIMKLKLFRIISMMERVSSHQQNLRLQRYLKRSVKIIKMNDRAGPVLAGSEYRGNFKQKQLIGRHFQKIFVPHIGFFTGPVNILKIIFVSGRYISVPTSCQRRCRNVHLWRNDSVQLIPLLTYGKCHL